MKISLLTKANRRVGQLAYTLAEVMVGSLLLGLMMLSLYAGMSMGFSITQVSRENLRATQILLDRVEGIRLFNWNQLVYSNWIPTNFTEYYYPLTNATESRGITYKGTVAITNVSLTPAASYSTNMRAIVVGVVWTNNGVRRTRSMTSYSSRDGMQNYIYAN
jgi:hypothetical protein